MQAQAGAMAGQQGGSGGSGGSSHQQHQQQQQLKWTSSNDNLAMLDERVEKAMSTISSKMDELVGSARDTQVEQLLAAQLGVQRELAHVTRSIEELSGRFAQTQLLTTMAAAGIGACAAALAVALLARR